MKVILKGKKEDPKRIAGSTPLTAELDDENIGKFKLRKPLERFGQELIEQMRTKYTQPASGEIIGVNFTLIEFSLVIGPKAKK